MSRDKPQLPQFQSNNDAPVIHPSSEIVDALPPPATSPFDPRKSAPPASVIASPPLPSSLSDELTTLYNAYRQTAPIFMAPASISPDIVPISSPPIDANISTQMAMSPSQHQLTLEEGAIWSTLSEPTEFPEAIARLDLLAEQSLLLSKSYQKRGLSPTEQTYDECKTLIEVMGVPWIESTVPFEAEALAASLVIHGLADYVVSEDTVRFFFQRVSTLSN